MIENILNKMAEIVAKTMTCFQSDFEKYDKEYIVREGVNAFLFCGWYTSRIHTSFVCQKLEMTILKTKGSDTRLRRVVAGFMLICGPLV